MLLFVMNIKSLRLNWYALLNIWCYVQNTRNKFEFLSYSELLYLYIDTGTGSMYEYFEPKTIMLFANFFNLNPIQHLKHFILSRIKLHTYALIYCMRARLLTILIINHIKLYDRWCTSHDNFLMGKYIVLM